MSELTGFGSSQENRTQRRWLTQSNMASRNHTTRGTQNTPGQSTSSVAGNAAIRPEAETSQSTRKWIVPDVGLKQSRNTIKSKAKEGLEGLKTGKIAQKLGEIAVANDLAYVPRMPDDALIGINEDEKHSRESYVQVHHSAIDFTRQLPKGRQPAYYNPDTHTLVPRRDELRPHTMHPLQAEQLQEPLLDLLDMELIANKPRTMPDFTPSITVSMVEGVNENRPDLQLTRQRTNPGPAPKYSQRRQASTTKKPQTSMRPTNSTQKSSAQVPLPARPAERPSTRTSSRPQANTRHDDRSELFLSPPPTFQDHPAFDVLQPNSHSPVLRPIQTNIPRSNTTHRPTHSAHPTNLIISQPARPPHHHSRPPATWAGPTSSKAQPPTQIRSHKPATITPLPFDPEPGPKTPPLSLEDVNTFSPQTDIVQEFVNSVSLSRSDSEQRRQRSKSVRRGTVVHRQKTSQEIWENKFAVEAESAKEKERERERERERTLSHETQTQRQEYSGRISGEVKTTMDVEAEAVKQQRQAREKADFERRHQERVRAMQAEIQEDEKRAKQSKRQEVAAAGGLKFRPRPTAKTFEPDGAEHRLRTRTVTQTNPQGGNSVDRVEPQLRPTARTFETNRTEHTVRAGASRTSQRSQQQDQQPQPSSQTQHQPQPQSTQPQTQPNQWRPNPNARTFETVNGAAGTAGSKGWGQGWSRWRRG